MTQYHRFFLSLLLVISPYLISGAPTSASISLPKDDALSTYYCTDYPAWNGPSFNPRDCVTAVSQFYFEVFEHGDMLFEFRVIGGRAQSRYPPQRTPQRFTFKTCTMAIVMLAAFHPEGLPGVPPSRVFAPTDVASYNDAWNAVKQVINNCISKYLAVNETVPESGGGMKFISQTGWGEFGHKGDIGVFLWDTRSRANQKRYGVNFAADGLRSNSAPLQLMNSTQPGSLGLREGSLLNIA